SGSVVGNQLDRNGQSPAQLARQIDRNTAQLAASGIFLREDRVAEIDRGAQPARRRQVLRELGAHALRRAAGREQGKSGQREPLHAAPACGATDTPRTPCVAMARATKPDAFASSTNSRRYFAPACRASGVPIAC